MARSEYPKAVIEVITVRAAVIRLLAATERKSSAAADSRWGAGRIQRDKIFAESSRDNRLAHQTDADDKRKRL